MRWTAWVLKSPRLMQILAALSLVAAADPATIMLLGYKWG